jgi:multimeric flavodoxin WrbA
LAEKRLLIVYYSHTGGTQRMAELIREGAEESGVSVDVKRVEDCTPEDLVKYDGIVVGSPTYFSNVAWQVKRLIDESITLYRNGHQLEGRVGGCFTSSGTRGDAEECIKMLMFTFGRHHRMQMVPGIIMASWDKDEQIAKICREYGGDIARKIVSS